MPLGTGNDLARALKWGPGYRGEKLEPIIAAVRHAQPAVLDRYLRITLGSVVDGLLRSRLTRIKRASKRKTRSWQ